MVEEPPTPPYVAVSDRETVVENGPLAVQPNGTTIALFAHDGSVYATDNRCPHMGFPLTDGTVEDGILTCHWHHARFELSCGDTLDPFADDLQAYPVEVVGDTVYVDPTANSAAVDPSALRDRLEHGLQENLSLVIAKAVIGLEAQSVDHTETIARAVEFGTAYDASGWGRGLTTLAVMHNLYDVVGKNDRPRTLHAGVATVADACAGQPPYFAQEPLDTAEIDIDRLDRWFRDSIDVRDADGAERVLRTAIANDLSPDALATMLIGAATDHRYLDSGHRIDFLNKAFETLEAIGWDHAPDVLASQVPGLASASRAEESAEWRRPIDIAQLVADAHDGLRGRLHERESGTWTPSEELYTTLAGDDPAAIVDTLTEAIEAGAAAHELAQAVTRVAARRIAQFGTANEFRDWNTVHHTYSYANAVSGLATRTDSWVVYRGIYDAAMSVYLDRFLNTPPTPVPERESPDRTPDALLDALQETFEVERDAEVDRAGSLTAAFLDAGGDPETLISTFASVVLREDVGFHTRQNLEAAATQTALAEAPSEARIHLIATARYLSAHTPTRRQREQTYRIAERLHRGEQLHERETT